MSDTARWRHEHEQLALTMRKEAETLHGKVLNSSVLAVDHCNRAWDWHEVRELVLSELRPLLIVEQMVAKAFKGHQVGQQPIPWVVVAIVED